MRSTRARRPHNPSSRRFRHKRRASGTAGVASPAALRHAAHAERVATRARPESADALQAGRRQHARSRPRRAKPGRSCDEARRVDKCRGREQSRSSKRRLRPSCGSRACARRSPSAMHRSALRYELRSRPPMRSYRRAPTRLSFISQLRGTQRLKTAQISALQAAAKRVERKSDQIQATAVVDGGKPRWSPGAGVRPQRAGRSRSARPAIHSRAGRRRAFPVGWGVIAVDPAVIPLGTRLTIPGYGEGVAADTGAPFAAPRSTCGSRRSARLEPGAGGQSRSRSTRMRRAKRGCK